MRKMIALFVGMAFVLGTIGFAAAQTSTPAPAAPAAPAPAPMEKKTMQKKPAAKKMTLEEKKAACLEKAGTDEAKKAKCEKQYTAKAKSMGKKAAAGQTPAPTGEKKQ